MARRPKKAQYIALSPLTGTKTLFFPGVTDACHCCRNLCQGEQLPCESWEKQKHQYISQFRIYTLLSSTISYRHELCWLFLRALLKHSVNNTFHKAGGQQTASQEYCHFYFNISKEFTLAYLSLYSVLSHWAYLMMQNDDVHGNKLLKQSLVHTILVLSVVD